MKQSILGAGVAVALLVGTPLHAQESATEDVPTFRWCMDQVMASLLVIVAPPEAAGAITMNLPDDTSQEAPVEPPGADVPPPPPPPPPLPAREPPLNEHLARQCPIMRIEAGDVALSKYCDPASPHDNWICRTRSDGDTLVIFGP